MRQPAMGLGSGFGPEQVRRPAVGLGFVFRTEEWMREAGLVLGFGTKERREQEQEREVDMKFGAEDIEVEREVVGRGHRRRR